MSRTKLLKLILALVFLSLIAAVIALGFTIRILDWSTQEPYTLSKTQASQDYYLISYYAGPEIYKQNQNMLNVSAVNKGFDFVYSYRAEHIDPEYIAKHPILKHKVGAGYWLWKPYLIHKTLQQIPEGAVLMYIDTGLLIRQPLREYLESGLANNDILLFRHNPKDYGYASRCANGDTFAALNCLTEDCLNGHHVMGGLIVVRNTVKSRKFIAEWLKYCEDEKLLTGSPNNLPNYPGFSHQQHDEGILSVLAARESEEVNFLPIDQKFSRYFKLHRRKTPGSLLRYIIWPCLGSINCS